MLQGNNCVKIHIRNSLYGKTTSGTRMKTLDPRLSRALLLVFVALIVSSCHDVATSPDQIVGSGRIVPQYRTLDPFSGVHLTGIGSVYVTQDTTQSFRLEADDNIIDRVITAVDNKVLTISLQPGSYSKITINVFVSMKSVELLELTGTGSFTTTNALQSSTLTCRIDGTGSMTLRGSATEQVVQIQGTGEVHSFDLTASRCTVALSGTGNVEVTATQRLDATLSGVGSIVYGGNPPELTQHISGLGTIRRRS